MFSYTQAPEKTGPLTSQLTSYLQAKAVLYNKFVCKLLASAKHPITTSHVLQSDQFFMTQLQKGLNLHVFITHEDKARAYEDVRDIWRAGAQLACCILEKEKKIITKVWQVYLDCLRHPFIFPSGRSPHKEKQRGRFFFFFN